MRALLVATLAIAACSTPPPLDIELAIQDGSGGTCPQAITGETRCDLVKMPCATMLLVRVVDPQAPEQPLIQSCLQVTPDRGNDLCAIASTGISPASLPASLPERTLEVQVAVLPSAFGSDGQPDCEPYADTLMFSLATGQPESEAGAPPIAGHAYYHPGDAVTVVELGCPDLPLLTACTGGDTVAVSASIVELDTQISVSTAVADALAVSIGEPMPSGSGFALNPGDATPLSDDRATTPPEWTGTSPTMFTDAACLVISDQGTSGTTPTLTCTANVAGKTTLDLAGVHISAARLKQITDAVTASDPQFDPNAGLVVGIVLDQSGNPQAGATVTTDTGAAVSYVAADGMSLETTGTTRGGIFVSTDAPFATSWAVSSAAGLGGHGFGGLVESKVTVVVLSPAPHGT